MEMELQVERDVRQDLEKEVETLRNGPNNLSREAWLSGADTF